MPTVNMEMQFVKIQRIAGDLAEHPMLRDIPFDRIVNYAQELMQVVGSPKLFIEKTEVIKIENYRGILPCDFVDVIQVRGTKCGPLEYVAATDTFHVSQHKLQQELDKERPYLNTPTYKIQGNVIITSLEHEDVEIAYRAIPVDEDGWPMLPDNAVFIRAIEAYIKMQRFTVLFDQGQISQAVFHQSQQDYAWCVGQAQNELIMPSIDEMETITNIWNRLIPNVSAHRTNFAFAHNKEYITQH